ncbi:response regulator transcription factor [Flagellimonas spongiicola]|uniref:response regulator transcription factor n=1 Tax=Flagellimonas spongiicola TaxID=2942208 RepID=UPI0024BD8F96|nr:helix-turn-helix transcriptional regulator [Allomuricauda spongiicola]
MVQRLIFFIVLMGTQAISAQAVSGYVNFDKEGDWHPMVELSQVSLDEFEGIKANRPLTKVAISEDGYFKIDKKYFSDKNKLYQLHVRRLNKIVNDTVNKQVTFMLSNKDRMVFEKGNRVFSKYVTSNSGDLEWQKMRDFQSKLITQYVNDEIISNSQKSYVKDSLQILMVKLIGIKQLAENQLLDRDIHENPSYYIALLGQLKESTIQPTEYWFLEKRLAYLSQTKLEQDLKVSRFLNVGLIVLLVLIGIVTLGIKSQTKIISPLSRQEENIKNLILQGKSNKEIADELFISLSTVKTHITHIYNKLQVTNRRELLSKNAGTST